MKPRSSSDPAQKLLKRLHKLVRDNTSATEISRVLGMSNAWFGQVLSGRLDPEFDRLEGALATLNVPLRWFFDWALEDEEPVDPVSVLRALCSSKPTAQTSQLMGRIRASLPRLAGTEGSSILSALPLELSAIDELRFRDRKAALEGVVKYIHGILKSEGPVAGDRERLAIAIAIWGSILRCLEQSGNAAAVFPLALEIAGTARSWTLGVVLQKSSFLLRYCGEVRQALCFCGLAADCFLICGHLESFGQTLVDKAIFLVHLGEFEEAHGIAQTSLRLLGVSDWRNQVAVHQTLSACAREQDDLLGAQHHLDRALKLFGDRTDSSKAHLCWSMARLLTKADQAESAIHHLEMAFGWMGEFGMPADIGLVALDLGHAYLLSNERGKLQHLTETIMTLSPVLRRHVVVDRVLMEFVRYTVAGEVNLGFIEMAKRKIQGASPGARPVLD